MNTDNRRIHIALWDLPNEETCKVTVSYPTLPGANRTYMVHVQPLVVESHDGYSVERYSPHRGYRTTLEAAARYSRKRLEALAASPSTFETARSLFDRVLADVNRGDV